MKESILKALSQIIDPDLHKDIVTLGFIKDLKIDKQTVSLSIELTTPACPIKEQFRQQAEQLILALPGVESVQVTMTAQTRQSGGDANEVLKNVRHVIAISSCKGGVGKSTVTTNLAVALAEAGAQVGLLDADIFGPSQATMMGIPEHAPAVIGDKMVPHQSNGIRVMSTAFLLPPGEAAVFRGPMVTNVIRQILTGTLWGELDYLLIDMPPGTGDVQITLSQIIPMTGTVIVTTPQKISLIDVEKGIRMFEAVKVPVIGIIENMSHFICDHCETKHELFGKSLVPGLCERYGVNLLGSLPFTSSIAQGGDLGLPAVLGDGPESFIYRDIAEDLVRQIAILSQSPQQFPKVDFTW